MRKSLLRPQVNVAVLLLGPATIILYMLTASNMKANCLSCVTALLAVPFVYGYDWTSPALNQTQHNLIPSPDGAVIYYNGTGNVPSYQQTSPVPNPLTPLNSSSALVDAFYKEIIGIANGTSIKDNCSQCIAAAEVMHFAALTQPVSSFVDLVIRVCQAEPTIAKSVYAVDCRSAFASTPGNTTYPYSSGAAGLGAYYAQLFSKMSVTTGDFQLYCYQTYSVCSAPATIGINEDSYFSKKPASAYTVPTPSGQNINVLHLSDYHLDPRYEIGSEANCTTHLCCRPDAKNAVLNTGPSNASLPASRFGALRCDSPPDLALSAFQSMPQFFNMSSLAFSIFTGDIVSHDNDDQLSLDYVSYEEEVVYSIFKGALGSVPLYPTLGNHDSWPEAFNTQNDLNVNGANAMGWNYQLLSSMWANDSWINSTEASYAATHYAAYAHTHSSGVRIISINTDFWYRANVFNYWNTTNPDTSGILQFLISELAGCEARNQRAWIIGHVLSGYDGSNPLPNPTALFYSIVVRFAPKTVAGIFFGHTHQQQYQIFYDFLPNSTYTVGNVTYRNTSMIDYTKPLMTAYIGPSIVPLTNLNSGYTLYQVDSSTFSITGMQTYFANISNSLTWTTPVWEFEYDTRKAYTPYLDSVGGWPNSAPLNATFWDKVTQVMLNNTQLSTMYTQYSTKKSVVTPDCSTLACAKKTACYLRSGSAELGRACAKA